ncbi:hypothetical protein LVY75_35165 (plasmid) [Sinorhizobium sp. B11]
MLDIIINSALGIVATTDSLIARARREAPNDPTVQTELDLLRDTLYLLGDAVDVLRRACEGRKLLVGLSTRRSSSRPASAVYSPSRSRAPVILFDNKYRDKPNTDAFEADRTDVFSRPLPSVSSVSHLMTHSTARRR